MEELAQDGGGIGGQRGFVERAIHQLHPPIACALIDRERRVAHPQARVAALIDVVLRPAEAVQQEPAEARFGARQILRRIHRAQDLVFRHLRIERAHETRESLVSYARENLVFGQRSVRHCSSMSDEAPKSALELAMERLRKKDVEEGRDERLLSREQKDEIAEIRRVYAARLAQAEILHSSALMSAFEPDVRQKIEAEYRRDVERLNDERDRKVATVRDRRDD